MKKKSRKSNIRKAAGTGFLKAGAIVIAIAMTLGAGVLKLSDVGDDEILDAVNPPYVIEDTLDLPPEPVVEADVPEKKEREKMGLSAGSILLYIGGWLVSALAWLLKKFMGPVAARVIGWIIFAAVVFGAIFFALKKAFPDLKLKDLIPTKTTVLACIAVAAVIALGELAIHFYGSGYSMPVQFFAMIGGLVIVLVVFNTCSNIAMKIPLREA